MAVAVLVLIAATAAPPAGAAADSAGCALTHTHQICGTTTTAAAGSSSFTVASYEDLSSCNFSAPTSGQDQGNNGNYVVASVTIDWGDGTTSQGTANTGGACAGTSIYDETGSTQTVVGSHAYKTAGQHTVTVSLAYLRGAGNTNGNCTSPCTAFGSPVTSTVTTSLPSPQIVGRAVDSTGAPVAGVRVKAGRGLGATTGPDGRYVIHLRPGTTGKFRITASVRSFFRRYVRSYYARIGEGIRRGTATVNFRGIPRPPPPPPRRPPRGRVCAALDGVYVSRSQPNLALRYLCAGAAAYVKLSARSLPCGSAALTPQAVDPRNTASAFYSQFRLAVLSNGGFSGQGRMFTRGTQVSGRFTGPSTATVTIADRSCALTVSAGDLRYSRAAAGSF